MFQTITFRRMNKDEFNCFYDGYSNQGQSIYNLIIDLSVLTLEMVTFMNIFCTSFTELNWQICLNKASIQTH